MLKLKITGIGLPAKGRNRTSTTRSNGLRPISPIARLAGAAYSISSVPICFEIQSLQVQELEIAWCQT